MKKLLYTALSIIGIFLFISLPCSAEQHTIKLKITNPNSDTNCENKWCQVYVEIPAKPYMDKGWLREDLKNLRFNDGNRDLAYWVIPKGDNNYKINKLGLWLLVYNLQPNSTKFINMIIDDQNNTSYCNPRAASDSDKSDDRSSYSCAATVFPFYSYNLNDWKWTKYPSSNNWYDPNTKFIDNALYTVDTLWPANTNNNAKTGNEFTLHIDNMKFYAPSGKYYSEAIIYFLSQAPYEKPEELPSKPGYRLYIKKADDFGSVSDDYHYSRRHFIIELQEQKKDGNNWDVQAKTDWYPYNNSRHVFDIKVSPSTISLWINGKQFNFFAVHGSVNSEDNFIRDDEWTEGYFGFDRKGWKLSSGTDINYITLRNYFKIEPKVEVYGNTDLVVAKNEQERGKDIIELSPDVQRLSENIGGNTLDKYIFSTLNIATKSQIVKDFKLRIRNRASSSAHFDIHPSTSALGSNPDDWIVYWCDSQGKNCSINHPDSLAIDGLSEKTFLLKIIPSPSVLFNGGSMKLNINVTCEEDGSFDNAEFDVDSLPKLACYWKYKLPVLISWQKAHGYSNLHDYQVLVELNNVNELVNANDDGSDIMVTDNFGNKIPFWIKKFDKKNKKLSLWIKVPKIQDGNNTTYVWWGNSNFKIPMSNIKQTFDLYEDWGLYPDNFTVGCPDGTEQCQNGNPDRDGWLNTPTPDDFYNWWIIKELPQGNKILQADIYRNGQAIDVHNGLCKHSDGSGHSCDKGPYLFNGNVAWDHYEVCYKMNAGPYHQYSGSETWGNPQYNPVFVIDAGNMWGMEFFANKFIFRPYASGIDYVWQYQTYPKNILGESFPKRNKWYWVKVRVFKDKLSGKSYLRVKIAPSKPNDIDKDTDFKTVGSFTAPPMFSLPYGKIGFGGWDSGFYFDNIRVRKYVEGANGKEPQCSAGSVKTLTPREKISLSQPQISPPLFEGRSAYMLTETTPFSWRGDLKAFYADCYVNGNCQDQDGEDQDKLGTISIFGKIDDNTPKGLGYYLMKALPGDKNRDFISDEDWLQDGRKIFTHISNMTSHDFNGFDNFDLSNCFKLKKKLETPGTCNSTDNYLDSTEKLIKFVRGFYISDFPASKGRNMDSVEGYGNQDGIPEDDEQWKLGSILHSNPLLVGIPNMYYSNSTYQSFINDHRDRPLVAYFMSNDGMLHAFEIAKFQKSGKPGAVPRYKPLNPPIELWAYVPEAVLPELKDTTGANHKYIADGLLRAIDAQDSDGNWRTILVGGGGRGGNYIFAIDVTNPENPKFLWEINKFTNPDAVEKLGTTISAPALGKLGDHWIGIFGSGYSQEFIKNYTDKKAYLTVIDLFSGKILKTIKVNDKVGNVLTDITSIRDYNGAIKRIIFGDYYGAFWNVNAAELSTSNSTLPETAMLFKPSYYDSADTPEKSQRPITTRPVVSKDKEGKWWVFFGTGDYSEYDPNYPYQRFYGMIISDNETYNDLCSCNVTDSSCLVCGNFRNMTNSTAENPNHSNWFIELGHPDESDKTSDNSTSQKDNNERVLKKAEVFGGYVFFTTYQPENNPCGGGKSRFYAVKFNSGEMGKELFSAKTVGQSNGYVTIRSIELSGKGVPSQPMIYTGHSGSAQVVATGLVNTSTGKLEKIDLNPNKFLENIDIRLWRRVR